MAKSSLAHAKSSGSTLYAVLSLNVLQSLDHDKTVALNEIGIFSLGDLLHFKPIIYAQILVSVSSRDIGHDISTERYLDNAFVNTLQIDIPDLAIEAIEGIGPTVEAKFNNAFGITTIKELAVFPPFIEAQQYLLPDKEIYNERPSAPEDLMPKILGSVHSIARFNSYIKSNEVIIGEGSVILKPNDIDELNSELYNIFSTNKLKLYVGFIAGFKQSWINSGTHLGEIIHSLALAPGESRNISIIEWYRRQSSSRDEKTIVDEKLSNSLVNSRALNEVVKSTAMEHLMGNTEIDATTKTSGYGITAGAGGGTSSGNSAGGSGNVSGTATDGVLSAGANLVGGFAKSALSSIAGAIGFSAVYSKNEQVGTLKSESTGVRSVLGETQQNINDSTVQNSSNIRSMYSTIVVTDEQSETETIQTKNVTNYNHSHSLTIQYYEVLQRYEVSIKLDSWTSVIYVPFKPILFDSGVIQKYWHLLQSAVKTSFPNKFEEFNAFVQGTKPLNPNFDFVNNVIVEKITATSKVEFLSWYRYMSEDTIGTFGSQTIYHERSEQPTMGMRVHFNNPIVTAYSLIQQPSFDVPLPSSTFYLSALKELALVWDPNIQSSPGQVVPGPLNPTDELTYTINLDFSLKDGNGKTLVVKKVYSQTIKFVELYSAIYKPIILSVDLAKDVATSWNANTKGEIESHFNTYKYAYTRYLLSSIEGDQLSDIVESLSFNYLGNKFLENYLYPNPIAIAENYLIFKHKKIPNVIGNDPIWQQLSILSRSMEEYRLNKATKTLDTVFLPTAGVFAEAILGRSNASEFVDPRRFWNWQDSPIPFSAPQIAAITAGNHTVTDQSGSLTPNVPASNLNIINPPQYALPTTLSSALQAVQNGNMFRDMSKSENLVSIMGNLATLASTTATLAGNLSGDAAANALNGAVELGKQVAGMVNKAADTWSAQSVAPPPNTPTEKAAALNNLDSIKSSQNGEYSKEDIAKAGVYGANLEANNSNQNNNKNDNKIQTNVPSTVDSGLKALQEGGANRVSIKERKSDGTSTEVKLNKDQYANNVGNVSKNPVPIDGMLKEGDIVEEIHLYTGDLISNLNNQLQKYYKNAGVSCDIIGAPSDNLRMWIEHSPVLLKSALEDGYFSDRENYTKDEWLTLGNTLEIKDLINTNQKFKLFDGYSTIFAYANPSSRIVLEELLQKSVTSEQNEKTIQNLGINSQTKISIPLSRLVSASLISGYTYNLRNEKEILIKRLTDTEIKVTFGLEGNAELIFKAYYDILSVADDSIIKEKLLGVFRSPAYCYYQISTILYSQRSE